MTTCPSRQRLVINLSRQDTVGASLWYAIQVVALCDTKVDKLWPEKPGHKEESRIRAKGRGASANTIPRNFKQTVRAKFISLFFPYSKSCDGGFDMRIVRPTQRDTFISHLSSYI